MKKIVNDFNSDIRIVIDLIQADKIEEARSFFNNDIVKKYEKEVRDKKSPLVFFEIFFTEIDDYLNNEVAKILGVITKDDIVGSFYGDYKEDLKLAINKEQDQV